MDAELAKQLYNKYPFLHYASMATEWYTPMEFDSGWYDIVECMCERIKNCIEEKCPNFMDQFKISYMKEKFGRLMVFTYGHPDEIEQIIFNAEKESEMTCELCGKVGKVIKKNNWFICLCPECGEY